MRTYLGLDLETSTGNPAYGVILSIGCYDLLRKTKKYFYEEMRYNRLEVEPKAFAVNKFDVTSLNRDDLISLEECDDLLGKWIGSKMYSPLGFNVGTFDMGFVKRLLPLSAKKLGHGTVDLNAICMFVATMHGSTLYKVKAAAKNWARNEAFKLRPKALHGHAEYDEHHGLFDAVVAVNCLSYLINYKS